MVTRCVKQDDISLGGFGKKLSNMRRRLRGTSLGLQEGGSRGATQVALQCLLRLCDSFELHVPWMRPEGHEDIRIGRSMTRRKFCFRFMK